MSEEERINYQCICHRLSFSSPISLRFHLKETRLKIVNQLTQVEALIKETPDVSEVGN